MRPARPLSLGVAALAAFTLFTACGSQNDREVASVEAPPATVATTTVPATQPPTTVPPTTIPPTTLPPTTVATTVPTTIATTTTIPETTAAPVVLPEDLPQPEPVPPPGTKEPVNQVGFIQIPAIGVDKGVFEGVSLGVLDYGPGHWPGTAMPGQVGNVVVAGHRTSKDRPFYDIDKLAPGDEVLFGAADGVHVYAVNRIEIVNPDALWIVDQTAAKTATLFACHPKGSTRQRIVAFLDYVGTR